MIRRAVPSVLLPLIIFVASITITHSTAQAANEKITPPRHEITFEQAREFLIQNQRLQQIGGKIKGSLSDEQTRFVLTFPFSVIPINPDIWNAYGAAHLNEGKVRVLSIPYPGIIPESKVQIGDEVLAVNGESFNSLEKLQRIAVELQKRSPKPTKEPDILENFNLAGHTEDKIKRFPKTLRFKFRRGSTEWEEDIRLVKVPDDSFSLNTIADFEHKRAYVYGRTVHISVAQLSSLKTDDELAFVICHEASHIRLRHQQRRYKRQIGEDLVSALTSSILSGVDMAVQQRYNKGYVYSPVYNTQMQNARKAGEEMGQWAISPFNKKDEMAADKTGLYLMNKSGFDAEQSLKVIQLFMEEEKVRKKQPNYTHPDNVKRYEYLEIEVKKYSKPTQNLNIAKPPETFVAQTVPTSAAKDPASKAAPAPIAAPKPTSTSTKPPVIEVQPVVTPPPPPPQDDLGTIPGVEVYPESAGITETGVAEKVSNLMLGASVNGNQNIFSPDVKKIYWYGRINSIAAFSYIVPKKVFTAKWYTPQNKLFYEERFDTAYGNTSLTRTALKFRTAPGKDLMGKWRVRVWKKDKLIDDRYFQIGIEPSKL